MTTVEAKPSERAEVEDRLVPWEMRDVFLRIPLSQEPTDEELERINKRNPGWKIELGPDAELEVRLNGGGSTPDVAAELAAQIGNWRAAAGGGRARGSQGTYHVTHPAIGRRTRSPNISWISPALFEATPSAARPKRGFWSLCPTFVIEVRSPSDSLTAQQRRVEEWLLFGAELGWLVDPLEQMVWIYRPNQEPEQLERPATLSGESVLEGLEVDMTEVWALVDEDDARSVVS